MSKEIRIIYPDDLEGTEAFTVEFINAHGEVYNVEDSETMDSVLELIGKEHSGEYYADYFDDTAEDEEEDGDFGSEADMKGAFEWQSNFMK